MYHWYARHFLKSCQYSQTVKIPSFYHTKNTFFTLLYMNIALAYIVYGILVNMLLKVILKVQIQKKLTFRVRLPSINQSFQKDVYRFSFKYCTAPHQQYFTGTLRVSLRTGLDVCTTAQLGSNPAPNH